MPSQHVANAGEREAGKVGIAFCVHGRFATAFVAANADALAELARQAAIEIVVAGPGDPPPAVAAIPVYSCSAQEPEYNAALLAAPRYSRADFIMWCDASDRIDPDAVAKAAALLRDAACSAVIGGMTGFDDGFPRLLSPLGALQRREASLRFARAHEYGLVGNYATLAQLRWAGPLAFHGEALSAKARIAPGGFWRMSLNTLVFERSRPERYLGQLRLYDPLTLEHYLADAEHFLLQQRESCPSSRSWGEQMTAKRAALYSEAAQQASDDGEASCAILFAAREGVARAALGTDAAAATLGKAPIERWLAKALAEQVGYLAAIFSASRIEIEDHPTTRSVAALLPAAPALVWRGTGASADMSATLFVFATEASRLAFCDPQRDRACFSVSLEQLADLLASPLTGPLGGGSDG